MLLILITLLLTTADVPYHVQYYGRVFDPAAELSEVHGIRSRSQNPRFACLSSNEFVRTFCAMFDRSVIRESLLLRHVEHGNRDASGFRNNENKLLANREVYSCRSIAATPRTVMKSIISNEASASMKEFANFFTLFATRAIRSYVPCAAQRMPMRSSNSRENFRAVSRKEMNNSRRRLVDSNHRSTTVSRTCSSFQREAPLTNKTSRVRNITKENSSLLSPRRV